MGLVSFLPFQVTDTVSAIPSWLGPLQRHLSSARTPTLSVVRNTTVFPNPGSSAKKSTFSRRREKVLFFGGEKSTFSRRRKKVLFSPPKKSTFSRRREKVLSHGFYFFPTSGKSTQIWRGKKYFFPTSGKSTFHEATLFQHREKVL